MNKMETGKELQLNGSCSGNIISKAEFARQLKVSRAAVTIAVKSGRLHGDALAGKKINLEVAVDQWRGNTDPRREIGMFEDVPSFAETPLEDSAFLREEKAKEAKARRELMEHKLALARNEYRHKEEVHRSMLTCGRRIRQGLDRVPEWADELASLKGNVDGIRGFLREKIRSLEQIISDNLISLAEIENDERGDNI